MDENSNTDGADKNKGFLLIECPSCRTQIGSTAPQCYKCGHRLKEPKEQNAGDAETEVQHGSYAADRIAHTSSDDKTAAAQESTAANPYGINGSLPIVDTSFILQKELDETRAAYERELHEKGILINELEIKRTELAILTEQNEKLRPLVGVRETLEMTLIEKERTAEELEYYKNRCGELEACRGTIQTLQDNLSEKELLISRLQEDRKSLQEEILKMQSVYDEVEEKKRSIALLKGENTDLKAQLKEMNACTNRDKQLGAIRMLLEQETKRKEKLQQQVERMERMRSILRKLKKENEMLHEELDQRDSELDEMEKLNELWNREKKEATRLREELEKKTALEKRLKEQSMVMKTFEDTIRMKDDKIAALEHEITGMKECVANLKKLEDVIKNERESKNKLKDELDARANYIHKLERRLIELERAIPQVKCPACKSDIRIDAKSCPHCGAVFSESLISLERSPETTPEEIIKREETLAKRETELQQLYTELKEKEKLANGKWETLKFKEEELTRRINELEIKTAAIEEEKKFLSGLKNEMKNIEQMVKLNEELNTLKAELRMKEESLRDREQHVAIKMQELQAREFELMRKRPDAEDFPETELAVRSPKRDKFTVKIKTGSPRLDDLLYGGLPAGSSILLNGPSFIGKETLGNLFIAEGINRDIPSLYITFDENYAKIVGKLSEMVTDCEKCKNKDVLRFIDLYTTRTNPALMSIRHPDNVEMIQNIKDTDAFAMTINRIIDEMSATEKYYRILFPLSSFLMNMDARSVIKFLEPVNARVKMDSSVAFYTLNPGLHEPRDVEMIKHIMDGFIEFRMNDIRKMFSIHGISNVQTRGWIEYDHTETGLIIGSLRWKR